MTDAPQTVPARLEPAPRATDDPLKLLANPTTRSIIDVLSRGPSYPRAIALAVGLTEGDAQRKLHRLERAGIVRGAWRHRTKTVKEYRLVASALVLDLSSVAEGPKLRLLPIDE